LLQSLAELHQSLMQEGKFDYAKFAALFMRDNTLLKQCLVEGANFADLLAVLGDCVPGAEREIAEASEALDQVLLQMQEQLYRQPRQAAV